MDKQTVLYSYHEILLSNKKEWTIIIYNLNKSQKHAEWKKPETRVHTEWIHLYAVLEYAKLIYGDKNQNSDCFRCGEESRDFFKKLFWDDWRNVKSDLSYFKILEWPSETFTDEMIGYLGDLFQNKLEGYGFRWNKIGYELVILRTSDRYMGIYYTICGSDYNGGSQWTSRIHIFMWSLPI